MSEDLNVVLLGGPGAGKGTQAELLQKSHDFDHLSTGDILRSEVSQETELGLKAKKYMEKGDLVPDQLIIDMVENKIHDRTGNKLFDGFPRTVEQARALDELINLDQVIYIQVSEEEVIRRLSARRVCSECGTNYNVLFKKPEEEGVCDECGGDLIQREDDTPEVIEDRYETFLNKTAPLIEFYQEKGILQKVDGEQEPNQVHQSIVKKLNDEGC